MVNVRLCLVRWLPGCPAWGREGERRGAADTESVVAEVCRGI